MIHVQEIIRLVEEKVGEGPLFLVDAQVLPGNKIQVEIDGDHGVSIDDCVAVSRHIEGSFDREQEDFELQVASAGLGRPLKVRRQYQRNLGREVTLRMLDGTEAQGVLEGAEEAVKIKLPAVKKKNLPERTETFAWDQIKECKVRISFK